MLRLALILLTTSMTEAAAHAAQHEPPREDVPPLATTGDLAFGAYQRGDFDGAMREANKRLAENPKDGPALTLIGRLYAEGAGVARDAKVAADWFRRAADAGDAAGAYLYGAAMLAGSPSAADLALAKTYLEKAAARNNPAALNLLGEMALHNDGGQSDFPAALGFFRRGASAGDADAAYALGELLKHGKGVAKNDAEAARWFQQAADQDHPGAMIELAILKFNGAVDVPRDVAGAAKLLRRAANLGNPVAQNRLAYLFAQGQGVERNLSEATKLRDLSREKGVADPRLDKLLTDLGASRR